MFASAVCKTLEAPRYNAAFMAELLCWVALECAGVPNEVSAEQAF